MVLAITVPDRYGWVLLTTVGVGWLTTWQTYLVGQKRKKANIQYPQAYAEKAEAQASLDAMKFNCAQRAHQNTLEVLPQTILCLLLTGLQYPEIATALGAVWLSGRVVYTLGYSTGNPKKRLMGEFHMLASLGLAAGATWTAVNLVRSTL